jgi:DNA-binding response OmpR family regulator
MSTQQSRKHILVVDSSPSILGSLTTFLVKGGFSVRTASDEREALACLRNDAELPRAVVLGLMLSESDVDFILREVAQERRLAALPVIMMSSDAKWSADFDRVHLLKSPFDLEGLARTIGRLP